MASKRTPREITAEIISRLDVASEFGALGVQFSGNVRESGMISCYAWGRGDRRPSAWVNVKSGYYGDSGGKDAAAMTCSLFDMAVRAGKFPDWATARKAYAEKAGVTLGKETEQTNDWRNKLEFQPWDQPGNDNFLAMWCQIKGGITPEAVKAAGGQLAYWPIWVDRKTGERKRANNSRAVIAIPCYGSWQLAADPVSWTIWDALGREIDTAKKGCEPSLHKMLSIGPTTGATAGLHALQILSDPEKWAAVKLVWKVEGPADMLALWAAIPEADRDRILVITGTGGATASVAPHQAKLLLGLPVAIVPDCDAAGVQGAEKWCRAVYGFASEIRVVQLPWEVVPSHGKDVRDFLIGGEPGRTYADLLAIWESTPTWPQMPVGEDGTEIAPLPPGELPEPSAGLDHADDDRVAQALKIDVLGRRDDGTIEAYSTHLRRTVSFRGLSTLKMPELLALFGTPCRRAIAVDEDDTDGFSVSVVREALGHLASRCLLNDETKLGVGVWPVEAGAGGKLDGLILVNSSEAMFYGGSVESIDYINHPRYRGRLLSFESGAKPWYDFDEMRALLAEAESPAFRGKVANDLFGLFGRWKWSNQTYHPVVASGLALATWVQSIWPWRPRIDILGGTNTGKSVLCTALARLYGNLVILTSDTTAAGLRQEICNSAAVVLVDEVDAKNRAKMARQREILEMLRSASRGTSAIRGTGAGKSMKFTLRHLVWVAGISVNYDDQADRNRAIKLDLIAPKKEDFGKLTVPHESEMHELGKRCLATAMWCAGRARELAGQLRQVKVEGVDNRAIESLAVPAAVLGTIMDWNGLTPEGLLTEMAMGLKSDMGQTESDEQSLISDILGSEVELGSVRLTAGQVIELLACGVHADRELWRQRLESKGIKLTLGVDPNIWFSYQLVRKNLLKNSRWQEQQIDQYLLRMDKRKPAMVRCGGARSRGVEFPFRWFRDQYMGVDERSADF